MISSDFVIPLIYTIYILYIITIAIYYNHYIYHGIPLYTIYNITKCIIYIIYNHLYTISTPKLWTESPCFTLKIAEPQPPKLHPAPFARRLSLGPSLGRQS